MTLLILLPSSVDSALYGGSIITTIAGTGTGTSTGDGSAASLATVSRPGNSANDAGDFQAATLALLNGPIGIFMDSTGLIYFADSQMMRVRSFREGGNLNRVVGAPIVTASANSNGDGGAASNANVKTPHGSPGAGQGTFPGSGDGGAATSAQLVFPEQFYLSVTDSMLYLADRSGSVRRIDLTSNIINLFAGAGSTAATPSSGPKTSVRMTYVSGISADTLGNFYLTCWNDYKVRQITADGILSTMGGTGVASTAATLGDGWPVSSAAFANQIVRKIAGDSPTASPTMSPSFLLSGLSQLVKVDTSGVTTQVMGGGGTTNILTGPASSASLTAPGQVTGDTSGNVYIADTYHHAVRVITGGMVSSVAGTGTAGIAGNGGKATSAQLYTPQGIWKDSTGNIYISEGSGSQRIRMITASTNIITIIAGQGTETGAEGDNGPASSATLNNPQQLFMTSSGKMYFANQGGNKIKMIDINAMRIYAFAGSGSWAAYASITRATSAYIELPSGVYGDPNGNIYLAESSVARLRKVNTNNIMTTVSGDGGPPFSDPTDANGDGGPVTTAMFSSLADLFVDSTGVLYVCDNGGNKIRVLSDVIAPTQSPTTNPTLQPSTLKPTTRTPTVLPTTFSPTQQPSYSRQPSYLLSGLSNIATVVGNGGGSTSGNGGPATATSANTYTPRHMWCDTQGNLYLTEEGGEVVRMVDSDTKVISAFAGTGTASTAGQAS
eukprot:gene31987-39516_t